ncbi:MAG: glycosyltransferase family 2 protein [Acidobacteriota bacterium]
MPTSVSLVVVNYNGLEWIDRCLESIFAQTRPAQQVLVVDNASSDAGPRQVRRRWPQARLIELPENVGYAAACNRGIEATSGELVALLNNDIELAPNWLEALLEQDRPPWGFWASRILFASQEDLIDSAGDGMAVVGAAFKHGHGQSSESHLQGREVFGPCGAAALYRRSLLEETGGFDEDFFLIYEDADLSMRARLMGHRCLYVPQAVVRHHLNASIGTLSRSYVFYGQRNSEYVFWKNMPLPLLLLYLPERLLFNALSFLYFLWRGRAAAFLHAKVDFLKNLGGLLQKRRMVQGQRRLGVSQLRRQLTRNWLKGRRNVREAE